MRLDLSLVFKQLSSFTIVIWKFLSGNIGDGNDLGVAGVLQLGIVVLMGGRESVKGGGARDIGGSRAFSAPSWAAAECRVSV